MKSKKQKKMVIDIDEYIRVNKEINRKEELERNGGHWIAVNRPHKNKKKYDRRRDRKIYSDGLFYYLSNMTQFLLFIYKNKYNKYDSRCEKIP